MTSRSARAENAVKGRDPATSAASSPLTATAGPGIGPTLYANVGMGGICSRLPRITGFLAADLIANLQGAASGEAPLGACGQAPCQRKSAVTALASALALHPAAGRGPSCPVPASRHARAASILLTDLVGPFDRDKGGPGGPGGWWLLAEPELHLHGDVVVPDVAGWRRERMPVMRSVPAFELPPDWICEVLSPRTVRHDRRQKMRIYARERVTYLWFVEPVERTLEVYRLEGTRWTTAGAFGDDEKVRAEPFEEIELDLTRWWLPGEPTAP